jgi:hypothetical protein
VHAPLQKLLVSHPLVRPQELVHRASERRAPGVRERGGEALSPLARLGPLAPPGELRGGGRAAHDSLLATVGRVARAIAVQQPRWRAGHAAATGATKRQRAHAGRTRSARVANSW